MSLQSGPLFAVFLAALTACASAQPLRDLRTDSAASYATAADAGAAALGPRALELEAALTDAAWAQRHNRVEGDARLALVADWLAERAVRGEAPQNTRTVAAATRAGVPFPTPYVMQLRYSKGIDGARLASELARMLAQVTSNAQPARYGLAVRDGGDVDQAVVVLTAADVAFAPVPRHFDRADVLELRGRLAGDLQEAQLAVTAPDGRGQNLRTGQQQFTFSLPLTTAGVWAVELIAKGPLGPFVVANFPVYVDVAEPPLPDGPQPEAAPTSVAAVEAELLARINADRRAAGVPPLQPLPRLADVARAHSQDMADHHFVAHTSPSLGTTAERLQRAGLTLNQYGENVGMAATTAEVHAGLMASPGHRANIVHAAYTHVGIGAALELQGATYVPIVTELFATLPRSN